jgi:hypothetical protein
MNSKQESKLNMYNAVVAYSDASVAITAAIPAYATTLTIFKAKVTEIDTTAQLEAQVISGITTNKGDLKKEVCDKGAIIAAAGYAYATSINDAILQAKFNYSYSDLFKKLDDELPLVVQNLHDDANGVIASLLPYGVIAATLTAFQTLITEYSVSVAAPRNATSQRSAYGEQLVIMFKEADAILKKQLDKVALQFKTSEPTFYLTYKNNRIIIDAGVSTTQAAGTITDSVTTTGIFGVIITVENETFTATSRLDGSYNLVIPDPGVYNVIFTKAGYTPQTISGVTITLGQTTTLDVQLIPV